MSDPLTAYRAHRLLDRLRPRLAAVGCNVDLPVAPRDTDWDGDAAKDRVFEWAGDDVDDIRQAFLYHEGDPALKQSYKLGFADVIDGVLTIIPNGLSAAAAAMGGARGTEPDVGDDGPAILARIETLQERVEEELDDDE